MYGTKILETSTVPPFLFRAASHLSRGVERSNRTGDQPRFIKDTVSRGINTAEVIDPLDGYGAEYHSSLAEIDRRDLRHMLKNHVNYENRIASEFSSWSVSLLYVLVHAVRKKCNEKFNEKNGLLIYVMDTTKLSTSRIFHSRELLRECDLQATPNLMDYALGEYLIHGRIIDTGNLWKAVPLETLIEAGLFDSFPKLNDPKDLLKARVGQLRSENFFTKPQEISSWYLESLAVIARCFGDKWQGIVIMALVTFHRRYLSEDVFTNLAHELGRLDFEVPQLPLFCAVHLVVHEIPEAALFYEMIRKLNEREASLQAPQERTSADQIPNSDNSANGTVYNGRDDMDILIRGTVDKGWDDMDALIQEYRVAGAAS